MDAHGHLLNVPEYRSIAKRVISIFIQMPTMYLCENVVSFLYEIKSRKRNLITHIDPLRTNEGAIKKDIIPQFGMLVYIMQQQKKVIKDNFSNLLCALSCVILSANCSEIVFLHVSFNMVFCLISNFKQRVHKLVTRFFRVHHNEKGWRSLLFINLKPISGPFFKVIRYDYSPSVNNQNSNEGDHKTQCTQIV